MKSREIAVPVPLLLDPDLTASAKVLWIARQVDPAAGEARLKAQTGLSRQTLQRGLGQVSARQRYPGAPRVRVPRSVLADPEMGAPAKVLYGLLQTVQPDRGRQGEFTYATLSSLTQLARNTLKRAIGELLAAGWIEVSQANRLSPIQFRLLNPLLVGGIAGLKSVERRLRRNNYRGETLMKEYLSLLIDSDQFTDNARPGFLTNPLTGELLEFDRFYLPNWAFEFHGGQHDGPTELFTQEEVQAQKLRDFIKAGICFYRGIQLVVIRAADLTLEGIGERIPTGLPRRSLTGQEELIELLEEASFEYQAAGAGTGWAKRAP